MAEVVIDTREKAVLFRCDECGSPPQPLRDNDALRNPYEVSKEHNQAVGHNSSIVEHGTHYIVLRAGKRERRWGWIPPWDR